MRSLSSKSLITLKATLFLFAGAFSSTLLLVEAHPLRTALLLTITVWSFCRAYYFAFYVLERYIDPTFRFSGLISLAHHLLTTPNSQLKTEQNS